MRTNSTWLLVCTLALATISPATQAKVFRWECLMECDGPGAVATRTQHVYVCSKSSVGVGVPEKCLKLLPQNCGYLTSKRVSQSDLTCDTTKRLLPERGLHRELGQRPSFYR